MILLAAGCGEGECPREEPGPALRDTPAASGDALSRYREMGIEPRPARFSRVWDE